MNSWIKEKDQIKIERALERLFHRINAKVLAIFLTITYVISLVPLLWIGLYNVASADDFGEASRAHVTWVNTHNVFATIFAGILNGLEDWVEWMGYFTCNILMATSPIVFGEKNYWIVAFLMVGGLSVSTIYLLYMLFVKVFGFEKYSAISLIMVMVFLTVQCMPLDARVEAFYWYSGAVNYIFVHSMANFFYGLLLSLYVHRDKKQTWRIVGTSILGFFVGGGNQMTMLNVAIVLLIAICLLSYQRKWKQSKMIIPPVVFFFVGMILNIVAPGNFVRSSGANGMNPIKAIVVSLYYGLELGVSEWTTWPILVSLLLIAVFAWKATKQVSFSFPCPLLIVLLGYGLTSAMMTPPLFAVGNMNAGRLQALVYVMYILIATLSIVYVVGWCRHKMASVCHRTDTSVRNNAAKTTQGVTHGVNHDAMKTTQKFTTNEQLIIISLLMVLFFGGILSVIPTREYFTFTEALVDLRSGEAKAYYDANCKRMEKYHSMNEGVIIVDPIKEQPKLLFFSDITTDSEDWQNRGLARYLGVDGVVVKDDN